LPFSGENTENTKSSDPDDPTNAAAK